MKWLPTDALAWRMLALFVCVELGLGLIAWVIGRCLGTEIFADLRWTVKGMAMGAVSCLPMLLFFHLMLKLEIDALREIEVKVRYFARVHLAPCGILGVFAIALAAGIGEEVAIRLLVHRWALEHMPELLALLVACGVFGLLHPVSKMYVVLAAVIGAYLGQIWMWAGQDLAVPVMAHALYDFVAILILGGAVDRHDCCIED